MSTTYVERAYLTIDGTNVDCDSLDVSVEDQGEPVPTMNKENRAKGHKRGVVKYKLTAEVPIDADSDVDPMTMFEDGTEFQAVIEYEEGKTHTFLDCRFTKVDMKSKEGNVTNYSLDIAALDRVAS